MYLFINLGCLIASNTQNWANEIPLMQVHKKYIPTVKVLEMNGGKNYIIFTIQIFFTIKFV